jgi:S-adenosylmethionine-diacylgycerolhomoserine-N-methlytransferase
MLETAQARQRHRCAAGAGDATDFDPAALFGIGQFDHVMISFALSMIPDWRAAIDQAARVLARAASSISSTSAIWLASPPLRALLNGWLARFHVTPRLDLAESAEAVAQARGLGALRRGPLGYYRIVTLRRPDTD